LEVGKEVVLRSRLKMEITIPEWQLTNIISRSWERVPKRWTLCCKFKERH
jgi:hypothetical protein